ncbi:cytochrome P450 [Epithele typhae]|uniref:cytochrome P450 n=1 Tax=Epithele typhae TaxID=378194 RepID=UPI0020082562|nr:cytochrome P450 [Epithele typhae]KAH9928024.1 cytochrome P450 [Epithele typhae]
MTFLPSNTVLDVSVLLFLATCIGAYRLLCVPSHLRHIPAVPIFPTLASYISGEVEEQRVKRLILPFADSKETDVVLVYCLGNWMVQVLESKLGKQLLENPTVWKQEQSKDILLWRFIGNNNVFMANGEMGKRHARIVRDSINKTMPVDVFTSLSRTALDLIGDGGRVRWDDFANRYTLDAFGIGVIGYDFQALADPDGHFVQRYHEVMNAIANPLYVGLPVLERWLPRRGVQKMIDSFVTDLCKILDEKKKSPGNDVITYMFQEPEMTELEYRDNTIVMFVAGHDTTAGAISSAAFFLGLYPEIQERVREEVIAVMGYDEPTADHFNRMPYLNAVLRESMRTNTPSNITLPRISDEPVRIGSYTVPPGTPMCFNICAAHHNPRTWCTPAAFDPTRFLHDAEANAGAGGTGTGEAAHWATFGLGPRRCLARNFSIFEQRVLLSMLIREFRWSVPADSPHRQRIRNGLSVFALSLPENLELDFVRLGEEKGRWL